MKKILSVICVAILLVAGIVFIGNKKERDYDFLRLHIIANSNSNEDQNVKYEIKSELVKYLSPYFNTAKNKKEALMFVDRLVPSIENMCDELLREHGFKYNAKVITVNEFFPARTYINTTLKSGYYDAVTIQLGEAVGDNWWCVMYPPLCFVNKNENSVQINYKSRIRDWINNLFK